MPFVPGIVIAQEATESFDGLVADTIIEDDYKLAPGDVVSANLIIADNDMTIDYSFSIGPDGKIYFPNVGEIKLLGLTIPQAKQKVNYKIKNIYKQKYDFSFRLVNPRKVRVYLSGSEDKPLHIGNKKYVYIYGRVAKSGRFEYLPGKKFSDYISYAGGPNADANLAGATITRENRKIKINGSEVIFNGDASKDMIIIPGDVINVPGNFFYFSDFSSFANTILLALTVYSAVVR